MDIHLEELNNRTTEWATNVERNTEMKGIESISIIVLNVNLITIFPYVHCKLSSDKVQHMNDNVSSWMN